MGSSFGKQAGQSAAQEAASGFKGGVKEAAAAHRHVGDKFEGGDSAWGSQVRREVMKGLREKTSGGLTKEDLMVNKHGKIVSKKQHARGMKLFTRHLSGWIEAVKSARSKLSILGFRPIGGRSKEGKELYTEAKQIYDRKMRTESDS